MPKQRAAQDWLYPGSFDPPHRGHLDVIARAAAMCAGTVIVGIGINAEKHPLFSIDERAALLRAACVKIRNVRIVSYDGATAFWCEQHGIRTIVRGIRGPNDLDAESGLAFAHRRHGIDTILLATDPALAPISSRLVRQALAAGLPVDDLVPSAVAKRLRVAEKKLKR